ncbi:hypothetical protein [Ideonella paludis]|uniref:XRE family transcriptional regulator n=1 Tax=Ideonella paludis TaxID=1233411 RepID=A0ABS5E391_9BURK|nr:hypothetical protein [Ideonella paludis]MBQ0937858.1 hypothetical protein [Ideonella paludis]
MDIRASLAQLPDDQVIGPKELAAMLNTTTAYIYKVNSSAPDRLPPPAQWLWKQIGLAAGHVPAVVAEAGVSGLNEGNVDGGTSPPQF